VWFGDIADPGLLSAIHVERAALVVIAVDRPDTALNAMSYINRTCPQVPVIVRAQDLEASTRLLAAGAAHAYPETIESSLRLGATALRMLNVAADEIDEMVQDVRDRGYQPVLDNEAGKP
ncbi:MAG: NAD-binding protein, partial [Betaproteobacteria bacterium]